MIEARQGYVALQVRVQPKASRNAVIIEPDGRIRIALTAPPADGAANKALEGFLAKTLGVRKSAVGVIRGHKSREKTVALSGVTLEQVREKLSG